MRIEITRSGGFGGLTRTWSLEVSRTEAEQRWLPLAEAEAGTATDHGRADSGSADGAGPLVDCAQAASGADSVDAAAPMPHPSERGPGQQRDRFTYRISIGYTEVTIGEGRIDESWRELIERARAEGTDGAGHGPP
ncbi:MULTISPECIES: protealysin inhibitor emfourin [unclassified Arthrobacter]|uniref:protealysin inhibitor emfourin n=1 Tax=Arthrobacter sp. Leaf234 TaxID=1736303 RepID=UPI0006FBD3E8|nr:protealysin inhibitor emfourin [Arthrobacter sp. Leaf234]KQO03474.1 hypothetical protein ASF21_04145 [Arthrobacter sp. Leaf234]